MSAKVIAVLVLIAAVAGALWVTYDKGYSAGYAQSEREQQEVQDAQDKQEIVASEKLEEDRSRVRVIYRTITKEVERVVEKPVYRDICFDDDGMRVANAALAGALQPAREPDGGVPAARPAGEREQSSSP